MAQIENFDDAKAATAGLFGTEQGAQDGAQPAQEQTEQAAQEQAAQPAQETNAAADITASVANAAAQAADGLNTELETIRAQNQQLQQINEHLQKTIDEQNAQQQEAVLESVMPELDIDRLAFEDDETKRELMDAYANQMRDYVKNDIIKEMGPALDAARESYEEKERGEMINALSRIPELKGIEGLVPQMDAIIKNNPTIFSKDVELMDKYLTAYAMARGVDAMNAPQTPKERSAQDILDELNNSPEALELLEKQRADSVRDAQNVPAFSASSGAAGAALNVPDKPQSWDDAAARTRRMFGLK